MAGAIEAAVSRKMREARMFFDAPSALVNVDLGDLIEFTGAHEDLTLLGQRNRAPG